MRIPLYGKFLVATGAIIASAVIAFLAITAFSDMSKSTTSPHSSLSKERNELGISKEQKYLEPTNGQAGSSQPNKQRSDLLQDAAKTGSANNVKAQLERDYKEASRFLKVGNFVAAADSLADIAHADPNYKDVQKLYKEAESRAGKQIEKYINDSFYREVGSILALLPIGLPSYQIEERDWIDAPVLAEVVFVPSTGGATSEIEVVSLSISLWNNMKAVKENLREIIITYPLNWESIKTEKRVAYFGVTEQPNRSSLQTVGVAWARGNQV